MAACHPLCAQETPSPCPCPAKPSYGGSGTGTRLVHPRLCSRLVRSSPTDKPGAQGRNKGLAFCFVTFVAYLRTLKTKLLSQFQANAEVLLSHQLFPEDGAVKGRSEVSRLLVATVIRATALWSMALGHAVVGQEHGNAPKGPGPQGLRLHLWVPERGDSTSGICGGGCLSRGRLWLLVSH